LSDDDFEYTWSWFRHLRDFFQKAAAANRAMLFKVDQGACRAELGTPRNRGRFLVSRGTMSIQRPKPLRLVFGLGAPA
jgi:hypothetical protein